MAEATTTFDGKYTESIGRRKRAIARVRCFAGKGEIVVNERVMADYFPTKKLQDIVRAPLMEVGRDTSFNISVHVSGGGMAGQAEAVRLGISRCLLKEDEDVKSTLKKAGYLKRDSRKRERKKPGLKAARRAPQWSKR